MKQIKQFYKDTGKIKFLRGFNNFQAFTINPWMFEMALP